MILTLIVICISAIGLIAYEYVKHATTKRKRASLIDRIGFFSGQWILKELGVVNYPGYSVFKAVDFNMVEYWKNNDSGYENEDVIRYIFAKYYKEVLKQCPEKILKMSKEDAAIVGFDDDKKLEAMAYILGGK